SYDMHGHDGKRRVDIPGFKTFLDDGELFLRWVKKHYDGLPIFVMGHSMGALIATWLGLERIPRDPDIKGFILSSPYYVNAIKVPKLLLTFSDLVAKLAPTAKVPIGSFTNVLTHDRAITERHFADERDGIRAVEATMRFASALSAAQAGLPSRISAWRYPMFAVVAGDDKLADAGATETILKTIDPTLLEYHFYPDNYHENFNETNRDTIFADVLRWMEDRMVNSQAAQAQPMTAANGT
ncbi:MAG TPA: alpha/beta fold hydrolase, partial [Noviherbaspirillum sp.]